MQAIQGNTELYQPQSQIKANPDYKKHKFTHLSFLLPLITFACAQTRPRSTKIYPSPARRRNRHQNLPQNLWPQVSKNLAQFLDMVDPKNYPRIYSAKNGTWSSKVKPQLWYLAELTRVAYTKGIASIHGVACDEGIAR